MGARRALRAVWRLLRAVLHGLHGMAIVLLCFPRLDRQGRRERVRWWSQGMLRALGLRLAVQGQFKPGAKMIVANHVSWLDIMVVHAVCPEARFVAKAEVRHWPLLGRLVGAAETLYIERQRKRDAMRVVHHSAEALQAGDTIAVFAEGTTGPAPDGGLLPFHANLLQAAVATGAALQPVALRYADRRDAVSPAALWLGETTLAQTLWRLAAADGLVARLQVLPARASRHADRRALAATLRSDIEGALAALDAAHNRS
ncbi:MAG: 1-acyl-sn-glycerol-3-phosphate acyltransferase [Proteobacteria bacterium]|nr:1-acyl-sn-glycerol-3-phosphate acyltransferase [Pseudomonadota bacterium]